jgi:hypothetical protein
VELLVLVLLSDFQGALILRWKTGSHFLRDDLLDGQQWTEHPHGDATLTRNFDSINYLSLGLNVNIF